MRKFLLLLVLFVSTGLPALAGWTVTDLNPNGPSASFAHGTSENTQVGVTGGTFGFAALWHNTAASWTGLNPAGSTQSVALAISNGQQAGWVNMGGTISASLWSGTAASWVNLHPIGATMSLATGVFDGQTVGWASFTTQHAGLWYGTASSWVDLNPAGASSSQAFAVFDGQQVGRANIGDSVHASLWTGNAASWVDLGDGVALGVSDNQQVGFSDNHASLWTGTAVSRVDLNPTRSSGSHALGVSGGYQVGYSTLVPASTTASLWQGTAASWMDLGALLPSGMYASSVARSIKVSGNEIWVAGSAVSTRTGNDNAMLWHYSPVPEPTSLVVIGLGLVAFCRRRRR